MKLTKIIIKNFKSIDELEFDIKRVDKSYTRMFVGINEVGKSNILEAMSFLDTPTKNYVFSETRNQKNDSSDNVYVYFEMELNNPEAYRKILKKAFVVPEYFLDKIVIEKIIKKVHLQKNETNFKHQYELHLKQFSLKNLVYRDLGETIDIGNAPIVKIEIKKESELTEEEKPQYKTLEEDILCTRIKDILQNIFERNKNKVTFWKPSKEYLITEKIDLNVFKEDLSINVPLKNLFALSNYSNPEDIKEKINEVANNRTSLRRLEDQLQDNATEYVNRVWKEHEIAFDVRISDQLTCDVFIKDKGEKNKHNYHNMDSRSDGFKQFVSLILTLSIENAQRSLKNKLILIDEPEHHLHPSGVRTMRDELIKIGQNNYVFLSTHSNFMIANKNSERNIIIKKDENSNTYKKEVSSNEDFLDDEVLREAFGINIYRDFLTPNKLLVEGRSDKLILEKALTKYNPNLKFAIANGTGDNIVSNCTLLDYNDLAPLVIIDDDKSGKRNKDKILKIGNSFSRNNVFTVRDLVGAAIAEATIEDFLEKEFVLSRFRAFCKDNFGKELELNDEEKPIVERLRRTLLTEIGTEKKKDVTEFIEKLKIKLSKEYNPTKNSLEEKTPLLYSLVEKISEKFNASEE